MSELIRNHTLQFFWGGEQCPTVAFFEDFFFEKFNGQLKNNEENTDGIFDEIRMNEFAATLRSSPGIGIGKSSEPKPTHVLLGFKSCEFSRAGPLL